MSEEIQGMEGKGGRDVPALRITACGLAGKQAAVPVQALPTPHDAKKRNGDARLQAPVHVLVRGDAPAYRHQEKHIGGGVAAAARTQPLPAHLGTAPQAALRHGQARRQIHP